MEICRLSSGIPEQLLPDDKKQATEYFYLWTSVQPPSDKDSVLLAHSLLDESLENPILKFELQRKIYDTCTSAVPGFCWMMKFAKDYRFRKFPIGHCFQNQKYFSTKSMTPL
jgi:hypothetical protein